MVVLPIDNWEFPLIFSSSSLIWCCRPPCIRRRYCNGVCQGLVSLSKRTVSNHAIVPNGNHKSTTINVATIIAKPYLMIAQASELDNCPQLATNETSSTDTTTEAVFS